MKSEEMIKRKIERLVLISNGMSDHVGDPYYPNAADIVQDCDKKVEVLRWVLED